MIYFFRADSSTDIGTGHVMRCLTLATQLAEQGVKCHFLCRDLPGNIISTINKKGFSVHILRGHSNSGVKPSVATRELKHSHWLGVSQSTDAEQCKSILSQYDTEWLIVDHYALDHHWEKQLQGSYKKLMVIDDLADREHLCDLLLDQTFGRDVKDYQALLAKSTKCLCGATYALLRDEFPDFRKQSLLKRQQPALNKIMITMGGVDKENITSQVLDELSRAKLPAHVEIIIIVGASSPWLNTIKTKARQLPLNTQVMTNVTDMARLMSECDLAIGAAGSTSWERCCLGLPTIMIILADNQRKIATELHVSGAAYLIKSLDEISKLEWLSNPPYIELEQMSKAAIKITDGSGLKKVASYLLENSA